MARTKLADETAYRMSEYDWLHAAGVADVDIARRIGIKPDSLKRALERRRQDARRNQEQEVA